MPSPGPHFTSSFPLSVAARSRIVVRPSPPRVAPQFEPPPLVVHLCLDPVPIGPEVNPDTLGSRRPAGVVQRLLEDACQFPVYRVGKPRR